MTFEINKRMFTALDSDGDSTPSPSEDVENKESKTLEPKTRLEYFLNKISENSSSGGGSGGGSGGVEPVIVTITPTSQTGGTWTGAAWEGLLTAYNHNVAGFRVGGAQGGDQRWMNYMVFADGDSQLAWMGFIGPTPVGYLFNPDGTFLIETFT